MEKSKILELEESFEKEMIELYVICEFSDKCLQIYKGFNSIELDNEKEYISKNAHLGIIRQSMWMQCVIQIHKLVSSSNKNHKFRFKTILNKVKEKGQDFNKLKISTDIIKEIENELEKLDPITRKIDILRDQIYAHTDRQVTQEIFEDGLTINEMEHLLIFTKYFIHKLFQGGTKNKLIFQRYKYDNAVKKMITDLTILDSNN